MVARRRLALVVALLASLFAPAAGAEGKADFALPPEGSCRPAGGLRGWPIGQDAPPVPFQTGDVISLEKAASLRAYLPPALWEQRERFFYEGMRLEIGPCFRDYGPPAAFTDATQKFRGQAKILENGGLGGYTAGLPFPPGEIDPADPQAGMKWAWNAEQRWQGAGLRARFRVSDMVGLQGRAEPFEGEIFRIWLSHRADLADHEYVSSEAGGKAWVAGGRFFEPFAAREYAWRQYRDLEHEGDPDRSDDLHAYLPEWRRVRRINANQVEGLYMPSFSVGVQQATQIALGGGAADGGGVGAAASIGAAGTITTKRSGFEGLEIRPHLYTFRVLGVQDVLAPINAANPLYPADRERQFGPWGLSFASERWDLRRAVALEGVAKQAKGGDQVAKLVLYLDLQTLQPLYYMSWDSRGEAVDVGMFVGRWSEDRADYPAWPASGGAVRVIDPAGASFANLAEGGGWRRESWDAVAVPPDDAELRRLVSVGGLTKGR
jgi:hypothetical protein